MGKLKGIFSLMFSTEIADSWPTSGVPAAAPPPPAEGVCNYYVTRKRRYCKMLVKTGARSVICP